MTHVITVESIAAKPFHLFKTKKPVSSEDRIMWQTATDELVQPVISVHASPGLMKGWSLVALEMPAVTSVNKPQVFDRESGEEIKS